MPQRTHKSKPQHNPQQPQQPQQPQRYLRMDLDHGAVAGLDHALVLLRKIIGGRSQFTRMASRLAGVELRAAEVEGRVA